MARKKPPPAPKPKWWYIDTPEGWSFTRNVLIGTCKDAVQDVLDRSALRITEDEYFPLLEQKCGIWRCTVCGIWYPIPRTERCTSCTESK